MSDDSNGYLVCEECGSYYELQEGESPENFSDECDCGGKLVYQESLVAPKIVISFWKAIAIIFSLVLGIVLLMFIYKAGYLSVGLLFQLLLALPCGVSMGYIPFNLPFTKYSFAGRRLFGAVMMCFMVVIMVIGDQLARLGRENFYMVKYIGAVNVITIVLLVIGVIAGIYVHKTKYILVEN